MKFYIDNTGKIYQCETNQKTKKMTDVGYFSAFFGSFAATFGILYLIDSI
jgi:hypothetical protein